MKILICGSRKDFNVSKATEYLLEIVQTRHYVSYIHGRAEGIDSIAHKIIEQSGCQEKIVIPNYTQYGREAPLIRDREMVDECDEVIAIWNGKSRGTKYTIDYAKQRNKPVTVFDVKI